MASLRADVDVILDVRVPEPEATLADPTEDTVLVSLFKTTTTPPPPPREQTKKHRSREGDEARARKRERTKLETARRASLMYEEARQMRAHELAAGASSSRIVDVERKTTDGDAIAADTTVGVPTPEGAGSEKQNPPAY